MHTRNATRAVSFLPEFDICHVWVSDCLLFEGCLHGGMSDVRQRRGGLRGSGPVLPSGRLYSVCLAAAVLRLAVPQYVVRARRHR